jgi:hypothetical protein
MQSDTTIPLSLPDAVSAAIADYPAAAKARFLDIRKLIFQTAETDPAIGALTETLKWGEPSYAPKKPRTGTAIRVAWKDKDPGQISLFVNCQTSLIETWREPFSNDLTFIGNREITLPLSSPLPTTILSSCITDALTYHLRKS